MAAREVRVGDDFGPRIEDGRLIAATRGGVVRLGEHEWSVASQSRSRPYKVTDYGEAWDCNCEDFTGRREPCKHIFAVVGSPDQPIAKNVGTGKRKQYRQSRAYTKGQTQEKRLGEILLRDLVSAVPDLPRPPGARGPTPARLSDGIFCTILKVRSMLSGRRACDDFDKVSERGLLAKVPSYMVAARTLNRSEVTPILYSLLRLSAAPLAALEDGEAVAPDSTGIQTTSFGGWREDKHGERRQRQYVKVHAIVGTRTHVIIDAFVGDENSSDSPQFERLLRGAIDGGFRPGMVVADKAYLSKHNYQLASDLGVPARIPFKSNSLNRSGHRGSPAAWRMAYFMFQAKRPEFDQDYHRRSNVESVFSALKRKFGESIRSRTPTAQVNEVLCKLIAYNISVVVHEMYEHGIAPQFRSRKGLGPS